jgi:hypothetical protein
MAQPLVEPENVAEKLLLRRGRGSLELKTVS